MLLFCSIVRAYVLFWVELSLGSESTAVIEAVLTYTTVSVMDWVFSSFVVSCCILWFFPHVSWFAFHFLCHFPCLFWISLLISPVSCQFSFSCVFKSVSFPPSLQVWLSFGSSVSPVFLPVFPVLLWFVLIQFFVLMHFIACFLLT